MLDELFEIIVARKQNLPAGSYTASLLTGAEGQIVKKVGEEAIEVLLAAQGESDQRLVEEVADLFYHVLVLLAWRDLNLEDVEMELRKRRLTS